MPDEQQANSMETNETEAAAPIEQTEPITASAVVAKISRKPPAKKRVAKVHKPAPVAKKAKNVAKKGPAAPKKAAKVTPKPTSAPKKAKSTAKLKKQKPSDSKTAKILSSQLVYEGPLFRVLRDHIIEPGGRESHRDVIRHNGSVVILAVDPGKRKKDPWLVIERQYRHAAGQFLWELPAGKMDAGEDALAGAVRELAEETGYQAKNWSLLLDYFASPGFLGESMKVYLAEGLIAGDAHPEEDEHIDFRLVKLSDVLEMVDKGKIMDGKTLVTVLLYARMIGLKRKK
jgi:ADP-ribose pyrophosphatase